MSQFVEVPLSQGQVGVVDLSDADLVLAHHWWAARDGNTFYVRGDEYLPDGTRLIRSLHTFLTGWSYVDHRNGDGLDNRRSNLREATHSENMHNMRRRADNTSGFKGVTLYRPTGRYCARITLDRRCHYLGYFPTPEDAARAYDEAARELHGEFARLNFPDEVER